MKKCLLSTEREFFYPLKFFSPNDFDEYGLIHGSNHFNYNFVLKFLLESESVADVTHFM